MFITNARCLFISHWSSFFSCLLMSSEPIAGMVRRNHFLVGAGEKSEVILRWWEYMEELNDAELWGSREEAWTGSHEGLAVIQLCQLPLFPKSFFVLDCGTLAVTWIFSVVEAHLQHVTLLVFQELLLTQFCSDTWSRTCHPIRGKASHWS